MSGMKFDDGKLRFDLVDDLAERELVGVLTFGATKYDPGNWRNVEDPDDRYFAAARRHLSAHRRGELFDPESCMLHLSCAATSLHFLSALTLARIEHDDDARFDERRFDERLARGLANAQRMRAARLERESAERARIDAAIARSK